MRENSEEMAEAEAAETAALHPLIQTAIATIPAATAAGMAAVAEIDINHKIIPEEFHVY
ncbi:MAG: hypothetical protein Q8K01_08990 [Sulfurimicrobium sp.]|nr:hypothetical protein [Sulfurimicrobium sp.]